MFFYYVNHDNRVPTTEFGERSNFWVVTDDRVGLVTKVREDDFEGLLKKTDILVYSQFTALCKVLDILNAPAPIILEYEKFVEVRESEFHDDVHEAETIEVVNGLCRRLQGEQPPSGGKEEDPEDEHTEMKFRTWCSSFGSGTFVLNGTVVTYYGRYPLI
jgi:hypothetical protein